MKKLIAYSTKSLVMATLMVCLVHSAHAQKRQKADQQTSSLTIFPDDYDDDSTKSTPKSYNDKGPGCLFALEIGANISNLYFSETGTNYNNKYEVGGIFGGVLDIALSRHLYLEPALYGLVNGTNISINTYIPEHIYLYTAELPINILWKTGNARGNRFFFGLGGFVGYNFGGTISNSTSDIYPANVTIGTNKSDLFAPIDFGAGVNVGYQMKDGLFFRARYQQGLANLSPDTDNKRMITSSNFGAQVGYFFRHAPKRTLEQ